MYQQTGLKLCFPVLIGICFSAGPRQPSWPRVGCCSASSQPGQASRATSRRLGQHTSSQPCPRVAPREKRTVQTKTNLTRTWQPRESPVALSGSAGSCSPARFNGEGVQLTQPGRFPFPCWKRGQNKPPEGAELVPDRVLSTCCSSTNTRSRHEPAERAEASAGGRRRALGPPRAPPVAAGGAEGRRPGADARRRAPSSFSGLGAPQRGAVLRSAAGRVPQASTPTPPHPHLAARGVPPQAGGTAGEAGSQLPRLGVVSESIWGTDLASCGCQWDVGGRLVRQQSAAGQAQPCPREQPSPSPRRGEPASG